ncbi:MAG TPA: class II fructose-bisphosphate aldolase, partial [Clostridiaceae bacterium]
GASSVDPESVETCNKYGGNITGAKGIPEDMLRTAASMAVCKVNMDTDLRLAMTAACRKVFAESPKEFDPRKYLGAGRTKIQELVERKIDEVLGSANKL